MVRYFKDTRVKCKHTKDSEELVIPGVPNKISAEALKIVINSIYGKFGSELFFLYDRMAQLRVTINGQLMTMTLVEELEINGIHVISANTDGIIIKLPKEKIDIFNDITKRWNETNKMGADSEDYKAYYARDVKNLRRNPVNCWKAKLVSDNKACQSAAKTCSKVRFRDYRKGCIPTTLSRVDNNNYRSAGKF